LCGSPARHHAGKTEILVEVVPAEAHAGIRKNIAAAVVFAGIVFRKADNGKIGSSAAEIDYHR